MMRVLTSFAAFVKRSTDNTVAIFRYAQCNDRDLRFESSNSTKHSCTYRSIYIIRIAMPDAPQSASAFALSPHMFGGCGVCAMASHKTRKVMDARETPIVKSKSNIDKITLFSLKPLKLTRSIYTN